MAKKFDKVNLTDEEIDALKALIDDFENEDRTVRERQIRTWKKMEFYWSGFLQTWWDSVAHDWRVYGLDRNDTEDDSSEYYDKDINVFRAYLETIIAALTTTVPPVKCLPDDATNVNDVLTARGGTKIGELIYNHVDAPLLWVKAIWTYCLQGMTAGYNYSDEDKVYGEVTGPEYDDVEVDGMQQVCPKCGKVLGQEEILASDQIKKQEEDEYDPGDDDVELMDLLASKQIPCPQCLIDVDPELKQNKITVTRIVGTINQPKARQCLDILGGLYVKVPNWAKDQKQCIYLSYSFEDHQGNILEKYGEELEDGDEEISSDKLSSPNGNQVYERWGRLSPQYRGEYPLNTPTERHWWLRRAAFNCLKDEELKKKLRKKFPNGAYVILVNDVFVKACNQCLDDHWTITFNPMSNYVHYDPLGTLLTAIQEITSDLVSLELQTIEHSVPITFADPKRVNFAQIEKNKIRPGDLYPTLKSSSKQMSDDFFQLTSATVSPELDSFSSKVGELGQFVSGALPALYGGTQSASSRTASQYAMQGNRALQRLQMPYKMYNVWWKNIFGKMIPAYIKDMLEDERLVKPVGQGDFEQTVIRRSQLDGKIGSIHLEAPDGLPQTVNEIKDTLMQLIQTNNPDILGSIFTPENIPLVADAIGINDFVIQGEDDRQKQLEEIRQLMSNAPLDQQTPSVMPEMMVDNHKVQAEICRNFLVSEAGRQLKEDNEEGYRNILLHLQVHMQMMQQLMQPPPMNKPPVPNNPAMGKLKGQPPQGNNNPAPVPQPQGQ